MEGCFIGKDAYKQHFVPRDYLKTFYSFTSGSCGENDVLTFTLKMLHKVFILDGIKGDTLIDIGSGPTIYQFLSACESFREIIATDYTDQNREEMQRWLRKEPDAFDWSPVVKYVCELEGDREKGKEKEEMVRRKIRHVLKCDVMQANPLGPQQVPLASCVMSLLCLEAACKDLPTYRSALKGIASLVKPGGHFISLVALEEDFYMVGQRKFFCLYLEQGVVDDAVREAGFEITWSELTRARFSPAVGNNSGMYIVVAQKRIDM